MRYIAIVVLLLLALGGCESKEAKARQEVIIDDAKIFAGKEELVEQYLAFNDYLLKRYDIDFRIVTTNSPEDIDLLANRLFEKIHAHTRSRSGRAVLLLFNPAQDKVRLEVSQALEPIYTDAFVSYIERKGALPFFRAGRLADGLYTLTELVYDRAVEADAGKEWVEPMAAKSMGGGAKSETKIGKKEKREYPDVSAPTGAKPKEILALYLQKVLKAHNRGSDLSIYTKKSQEFFRKWPISEINQNNEAKFLAPCIKQATTLYDKSGRYAVVAVLPYDQHRTCAPYFFKKEGGEWRLDIANMAERIRFNVNMQWHFDVKKRLAGEGIYYAFAFDGYTFDKHGYPHTNRFQKPKNARWGFECGPWVTPQNREKAELDPDNYAHCVVVRVWRGTPAEVRFGLRRGDFIVGVGEKGGIGRYPTYNELFSYLQSVPSGGVVTLWVRRNDQEGLIKREGIAP